MDLTIAQAAEEEPEAETPPLGAEPDLQPEGPSFVERILKAETGPGPIHDYMHHPINFTEDEGGARLARGLTGMFENLNYAVIDVLVGGFQMWMGLRRRQLAPNAGS